MPACNGPRKNPGADGSLRKVYGKCLLGMVDCIKDNLHALPIRVGQAVHSNS